MKETAVLLIDLIETTMELDPGTLAKRSRKRPIVSGRRVFYFLMRNHYRERAAYSWLGNFFFQDHATVMHAIEQHHNEVNTFYEYGDLFKVVEGHFDKTVQKEKRDDKIGLINLLQQKYIKRVAIEKQINDLERLIKLLDQKPQAIESEEA